MTHTAPPPQVGDKMSFRKTMTVAEQAMFTGISGNLAPLYVDQRAARAAGFDGMLAFELAVTALATTSLNRLAGPAWRLGGLALEFPIAAVVGETAEACVEVVGIGAGRLDCAVNCSLADGELIVTGTATMIPALPRS